MLPVSSVVPKQFLKLASHERFHQFLILLAAGCLTTMTGGIVSPVLPEMKQALHLDPRWVGDAGEYPCPDQRYFNAVDGDSCRSRGQAEGDDSLLAALCTIWDGNGVCHGFSAAAADAGTAGSCQRWSRGGCDWVIGQHVRWRPAIADFGLRDQRDDDFCNFSFR